MLKSSLHSKTFSRTCIDMQLWKKKKTIRRCRLVTKVFDDNLWISHRNLHTGFLTAGWRSLHGTHDPVASVIIHSQQKDTSVTSPRARRKHRARWKLSHSSCGESRRNPFRTRAPNCCATGTNDTAEKQRYIFWQQLLHYSSRNYSLVFLQWLISYKATTNPHLTLQIDSPVKVLWGRKTSMKWKTTNLLRGFSNSRLSAVIARTLFGEYII